MGRPKGSVNIPNGYDFLVRFTGEQREWLTEASEALHMSKSEIIRMALTILMEAK